MTDTDKRCRHCDRPIFERTRDGELVWDLVYREQLITVQCLGRGELRMNLGHEPAASDPQTCPVCDGRLVEDADGVVYCEANSDHWRSDTQVCACCDEPNKPGAPGAGGAPWICNDCASPGVDPAL